jgi:GSH-dependent disulfide-bond oxidoreductase
MGNHFLGATMIDLYYWTTPNGHKITIFLEESELPYTIHPINIGKGDQFQPSFLQISPNNRIPAIVDQDPVDGSSPITVFESGAILQYLAEKTGRFLSADVRGRVETMEWLFWQMGGLGPMLGQNHHFAQYAPEKIPYAINRYIKETERLYGVLNKQLSEKEFITGEYSIADMAAYPWIVSHKLQQINLTDFPNIQRWFESLQNRPAIKRAYAKAKEINP